VVPAHQMFQTIAQPRGPDYIESSLDGLSWYW